VTLECWVSPDVNQTEVVSGDHQLTVSRVAHIVDMSPVSSRWEDTSDEPPVLVGAGCPLGFNCVGCARGILGDFSVSDSEEEELVSSTN